MRSREAAKALNMWMDACEEAHAVTVAAIRARRHLEYACLLVGWQAWAACHRRNGRSASLWRSAVFASQGTFGKWEAAQQLRKWREAASWSRKVRTAAARWRAPSMAAAFRNPATRAG